MSLRFSIPRVQGRGAGLGNELIPWARAFLAAKILDAKLIPPAFGMNSRSYWKHFGTPRYDWIFNRALEKILPVVKFTENDYIRYGRGDVIESIKKFSEEKKLYSRSSYIFSTEGMWGGYRHIIAARDFIYSTLYQSKYAAKNIFAINDRLSKNKITVGMHVRLGDFDQAFANLSEYQGKFNISLPLIWYRRVALSIKNQLGDDVQFLIVSDGRPSQLAPLIEGLNAITTSDIPHSDCSDLLALANSDLLVCSVSSFSSTAAFLSKSPYLWFEPNLQKNSEGFYTVWENEIPLKNVADFSVSNSDRQFRIESLIYRGKPVTFDGQVNKAFLDSLVIIKSLQNIDLDLIHYGVAKI